MLKKKLYSPIGISILFFLNLSLLYFSFAFFREMQFNNGLEKYYEFSKLELEKARYKLETKYTNVHMNDISSAADFIGTLIAYDYHYYLSFSEKYLLDTRNLDFLFKLPEITGKSYATMRLTDIMISAKMDSFNDLTLQLEYIKEWEKKGGKQENDWWTKFKKSQEYQNYISQVVLDRKNEKGENIEKIYNDIMNRSIVKNSFILDHVFNYWIIKVEKQLAKEAYKNYEDHIIRSEYYPAFMEVNIILNISKDLDEIEKLNLFSYLFFNTKYLPWSSFMNTQLMIDILYIIITTTILTIVLYLIYKNFIKYDIL